MKFSQRQSLLIGLVCALCMAGALRGQTYSYDVKVQTFQSTSGYQIGNSGTVEFTGSYSPNADGVYYTVSTVFSNPAFGVPDQQVTLAASYMYGNGTYDSSYTSSSYPYMMPYRIDASGYSNKGSYYAGFVPWSGNDDIQVGVSSSAWSDQSGGGSGPNIAWGGYLFTAINPANQPASSTVSLTGNLSTPSVNVIATIPQFGYVLLTCGTAFGAFCVSMAFLIIKR